MPSTFTITPQLNIKQNCKARGEEHVLTLFRLGFLRVALLGGQKVPATYNSKTINDNEMKFWWSSKGSLAK